MQCVLFIWLDILNVINVSLTSPVLPVFYVFLNSCIINTCDLVTHFNE